MKKLMALLILCLSVTYSQSNIHEAVANGNIKAVDEYIKAGGDINTHDQMNNNTPLMLAVLYNKYEIAETLIKNSADMNLINNEGSTALHMASFFCRSRIVELLVKSGADKNIKNKIGATPLQTVQAEFNDVKAIYSHLNKTLPAIGIKLDLEYIEKTRPIIAKILGD